MVFPGPATFTHPSYGVLVRVVGGAGMACTINWVVAWWGRRSSRLGPSSRLTHITARMLLVVGTNVMH